MLVNRDGVRKGNGHTPRGRPASGASPPGPPLDARFGGPVDPGERRPWPNAALPEVATSRGEVASVSQSAASR